VSRGSALIEVLVVGIIVVLTLSQIVLGASRMHAAGDEASSAAHTAAVWAARSGNAADAERLAVRLAPDAEVEAWRDGSQIHVTVSRAVPIVALGSADLSYTVVGRGSAAVSPFRSDG
jgi:hypothetical protein